MYLGYYCYIHLPLIDFLPYKVGVNIHEAMQAPAVEAGESETIITADLDLDAIHERRTAFPALGDRRL